MFNLNNIADCYKLDITSQNPQTKVELKQYSRENRYYHLQIVKKNMPVSLLVYTLSVFYKKPNKKTMCHPVEVINPRFGVCKLLITEDLINEYGNIEAEIYLKKNDSVIVSSIFTVKVNRSIYQKDDTPTLDMTIVDEEINKLKKEIGSVSELETSQKSNTVDAINEINKNKLNTKNVLKKDEIDNILSIFNI